MSNSDNGRTGHAADGFIARRQGFDITSTLFYEEQSGDPAHPELFIYTDKLSYAAGESIAVHASGTIGAFSIDIIETGAKPKLVERLTGLHAENVRAPRDFYAAGCSWPVAARWTPPSGLEGRFLHFAAHAETKDGVARWHDHGAFIRPGQNSKAPILLVASTCTWSAYNDWGGANNYQAAHPPEGFSFAPKLSMHRPWAPGFIWAPKGAPRKPHESALPGAIVRYPPIEFAYARGLSKWYANAGWASYEAPFLAWLEQDGWSVDVASQLELHFHPALLDQYACVMFVGHDEYWTWEMREAVERFLERGGRVARFAGNFLWQARLENEGAVQVCYKHSARDSDPVASSQDARRTTTIWDDPIVGWPGSRTFGLNALYGLYAHVGAIAPRGAGGFTIYRPDHWAFAGADAHYGDVFGSAARILGYEVDGLDYTFRDGLPYPTERNDIPEGIEIIAMGPAGGAEFITGERPRKSYYGDAASALALARYGDASEPSLASARRGSGMVVSFKRGAGEVFHAGTCEWVAGLIARDPVVETITRNVLTRFTQGGERERLEQNP